MVDRCQSREVGEEGVEQAFRQNGDCGSDFGPLGQDDVFGDLGVGGEEAPVDVGSVADVRVVVFGCCCL